MKARKPGRPKGSKNKTRLGSTIRVRVPLSAIVDRTSSKLNDPINHPPHYTFGLFEVADVCDDWFSQKPLLWQAVKYLARAGRKGEPGDSTRRLLEREIEDLRKGEWYLRRRIAQLEHTLAKMVPDVGSAPQTEVLTR